MGYTGLNSETKLLAIVRNGELSPLCEEGDDVSVVLEETPFYAEMGGQVGDCGVVVSGDNVIEITDTKKLPGGQFISNGKVVSGGFSEGETVTAKVDAEKRAATQRNHTCAHILQSALRSVLGDHVHQAGSYVDPYQCRFDFSHFSAVTPEELAKVEEYVNKVIMAAVPVVTEELPIEEAKKKGAMALFGEKYGNVVRVVKAGDFSTELCGGTHVSNTGKLGLFKIISESSVAAGVRRIEAVTGTGVLGYIDSLNSKIIGTAAALKVSNPADIEKKAASLATELKEKDREIEALTAQLTEMRSGNLFDNAVSVGSLKVIAANAGEVAVDELRQLSDKAKAEVDNVVAVFAAINKEKGSVNFAACCAPEAVKCGVKAGDVVRAVAKLAGGNGGGKPDFAMAGAKDITKVDEAISAVGGIVESLVK